MPCDCAFPRPVNAGDGGGSGGGLIDSSTSQSIIPSSFCFGCATFWIIIALIFIFGLAFSGGRR